MAKLMPPAATAAAAAALWYAVSYGILDKRRRFLLPPPHEVFAHGVYNPTTGQWAPNLVDTMAATALTGGVALTGFVVSVLIGTITAVTMSQSAAAERAIYPVAVIIQVIPVLALVPLIGFWWGFTFTSRVIACVLVTLFPIVANTLAGLKSTEPTLNELFDLADTSRWTRLIKLQIPSALPAIFTGWRIAAGGSVIGAIVGDFFFRQGQPGVGRLLDNYARQLQTEDLLVAVAMASVLGLVFFALVDAGARWALRPWHSLEQ